MGTVTKTRPLRLFGTPGPIRTLLADFANAQPAAYGFKDWPPIASNFLNFFLNYCKHDIIIFHIGADLSIF